MRDTTPDSGRAAGRSGLPDDNQRVPHLGDAVAGEHAADGALDNADRPERTETDQAADRGTAAAPPRGPAAQQPSSGARSGNPLGSQSDATGMGDGLPSGSSQGLAGAQGSGGGADQPPLQPRRAADAGDDGASGGSGGGGATGGGSGSANRSGG